MDGFPCDSRVLSVLARPRFVRRKARHPVGIALLPPGRSENSSRSPTNRNVRSPGGIVLHWESREQTQYGTAVSVGLLDALERVALDEELEQSQRYLEQGE